jgi:membrane protein implicated in regulation of membrane protease activity
VSAPGNNARSSYIAAALIIFGVGVVFFLMPDIMLWLAQFSPWLSVVFGTLAVLSFFLLFWLRGRYQRNRDTGPDQD